MVKDFKQGLFILLVQVSECEEKEDLFVKVRFLLEAEADFIIIC